ncbi:Cytochrome c peroxidase, mitochondrial [Komagataella phaffii CBS 7435]|uniref:Peroxidase n=2 Tax=Komagataella phaffii TaxID=460519 RepID=C4QZP5_KOMPG|nr:Mitochondrial cytochrome-c peroxidase [Komagataella phaffii GS115]AOA62053.1 GQ67_00143T0 [Komagataella phaffii]CAH2448784.1 Cytochrome c peroxidase, mitochondrial [Komagataella phaffii CBS 7435]AOA67728.1 GQ68_01245T0 [Komagataella phaffii GS115]CAY68719.1 Mitochondrial cytochrome-c peroxidase [Komagataella phaffii GS115]CCA38868.1 Cytochrome c peroxidase, mitochondrial [Komagataella phaffii CBS 7435]
MDLINSLIAPFRNFYQRLAIRLAPLGRVLLYPYVLFLAHLQSVHFVVYVQAKNLELYYRREAQRFTSGSRRSTTFKDKSQELDQWKLDFGTSRPIAEEVKPLFRASVNPRDVMLKAWGRTDYYYDRYVVHTPFCIIVRLSGERNRYIYSPRPGTKLPFVLSELPEPDQYHFSPEATRSFNLNKAEVPKPVEKPLVKLFEREVIPEVVAKPDTPAIDKSPIVLDADTGTKFSSSHTPLTGQLTVSKTGSPRNRRIKLVVNKKPKAPFIGSFYDYEHVRHEIINCFDRPELDYGSLAPNIVRLAWHVSATYDQRTGTGGSNGCTIRFPPELTDPGNTGLHPAMSALNLIQAKFPWISYADLYTFAGAIAIEYLGGPKIDWKPGRVDCTDQSLVPPNGRLPLGSLGADHIRDVFINALGFDDRAAVCLIGGGHALGRTHAKYSGWDGKWTENPLQFSNQFFLELLTHEWDECTVPETGMKQFCYEKKRLMMLNTDMALLRDPSFAKWVKIYGEDEKLFFDEFSQDFAKLLELGVDRDSDGIARKKF